MQPLFRISPRFILDSSNLISTRTLANPSRLPPRPSICLQCKIHSQTRPFANGSKPAPLSYDSPSPEQSRSPPQKLEDDMLTEGLPSTKAQRRSSATKHLSNLMDNLQTNIFHASQRLNDLTGYTSIEALKSRITHLESLIQSSQEAVRSTRNHYKTIVSSRSATQREVTTLLARKDSWTPSDLERFTSLYRNDHSNEQAVQEAAVKLAEAEKEAERVAGLLGKAILERYHEEQIWSDKIRRMSTWGTWGLMGVNVLLFLVFQFGFEPWRRRRLVGGFEEKVREALEREREEREVNEGVGKDEMVALEGAEPSMEVPAEKDPVADVVVAHIEAEGREGPLVVDKLDEPTMSKELGKPEGWKDAAKDLFSQRLVSMRKQDVTVIALEGAAVGATVVAVIAILLVRHP